MRGNTQNYTYDAWGRLLSVKNASGSTISDAYHIANVNPIRYRGYFYDTETKLYYCNSRYYDPQIKRFINADDYLSTGSGFLGYNMFAYCNNNPVVYSDSEGTLHERTAGGGGKKVYDTDEDDKDTNVVHKLFEGIKSFFGNIFGASSTTLIGLEKEVVSTPKNYPVVVESSLSNYKIVEQKGDSSKLFSVYHEDKAGSHTVGGVVNIFDLSINVALSTEDVGLYLCSKDGEQTTSMGVKMDLSNFCMAVESGYTIESDNNIWESSASIGANGGMLAAIICLFTGRPVTVPSYAH